MEKIAILHTNDLHSHFENWPRIKRYLINEKNKLEKQGYFVITVDLGDAMDRAHSLTESTNGKANVELLNQIHYDAVTIGNNEGLTNSKNELDHLYDNANFDVVLGNLFNLDDNKRPDWVKPDKLIETPGGNQLRLYGLTAPYHSTYELEGWNPVDDQKIIPDMLNNHPEDEVTVLLSHLGVTQDRLIASKFPKFDIIIGSHTHHLFLHGERDNHSLLAAAGKYGYYVGKITMNVQDNKVVSSEASVVKTSDLPVEDGDDEWIESLAHKGEAMLSEHKVANIPHDMENGLVDTPQIVKEFLSAMKQKAHTKAAIVNNGLFLDTLPKGIVDKNQLHKILPHSMHVTKSTFTGAELWRLMMEMKKNWKFLIQYQQKGMGFRGKYFGQLNYDGIKVDENTNDVYFDGEKIDFNKKYDIALLDHYIFIPFFPTVAIKGENHILYDQTLREVFASYLSEKYPLDRRD
ncbi:bifunctional metallophosphatase/5'-nucleotidase [Apilactobacillus bombintestini]|uniref:Bifunctional metallophosphatase/5'-nucleotidase n=1 Tax=Apilactobacillus bombintestini TaxID=2419772 RepID=A0A387ATQ5_9LACO|nr:metallophosphoesterase [Apilactobacillus bombintestini]AYF92729.1 bifunctional metallophosphatase/5'-nucleotidase [Apilactobacillus bombintestini]